MFNSQSHSNTHSNTQYNRSNRFNDWVYDDDVENTNEQVAYSHHQPHLNPPQPHHYPQYPRNYVDTHNRAQTHDFTTFTMPFSYQTRDTSIPVFTWSYEENSPSQTPNLVTSTSYFTQRSIPSVITNAVVPETSNAVVPETSNAENTKDYSSYDIVTTPFMSNSHRGYLDTRRHKTTFGNYIHYITIQDVFEYVTLGHTILDSYLAELTRYVTDSIEPHDIIDITSYTIHGVVYDRPTPVYSWEMYGNIAMRCLEWVMSNPEKISSRKM